LLETLDIKIEILILISILDPHESNKHLDSWVIGVFHGTFKELHEFILSDSFEPIFLHNIIIRNDV